MFLPLLALATTAAANDLKVFDGEWIYVEDRTPGRSLEELGPPMSGKFAFGSEPGAILLTSGHGSGMKNLRVAVDGTVTEAKDAAFDTIIRYTASWKDGVLTYESTYFRGPEKKQDGFIRKTFQATDEGLLVSVRSDRTGDVAPIALYRHPQDIAMPKPAKATIGDLAWLSGNWSGTRGTNNSIAFEERWTPPKGGSMFAVSRTISRDRLGAFEYLRILEREGGLVYIAQPGGAAPTEFIMTEFSATRAVFENPRHDYPKRIAYELTEGKLTATIGFLKGGTPRKFEFKREP